MDLARVVILLVAGTGAGLTGSVAGLASLISYPVLLAVGLSPITANVTNTVALVFNSVGSVSGSRPELRGQRARIRRLGIITTVGAAAGGALLLTTSPTAFERIVPWLIGLGSLTILVSRRPELADVHASRHPRLVAVGALLIGVYSGYFGAAAGVLLLALLLASSSDTLARSNALKNVVLGLANVVAAVVFIVFGHVDWVAAAPLAVGLFLGGRAGPVIVRHAPGRLLRTLIGLAGVGLACYLGVEAYG